MTAQLAEHTMRIEGRKGTQAGKILIDNNATTCKEEMPSRRPNRKKRSNKPTKPIPTRPRRKRSPGNKSNTSPACCLSTVAQAYAETLVHPSTGPLVGIPNGDTLFSKKLRVWNRGTITPDATHSSVHILCQPFAAVANDINTIAVVANGTALPSNLATGGKLTNAPYASSDFSGTGVQARLVSAVLRVKYTGTMLNAGGMHYGIQEPTHASFNSKSETDILATTCGASRSIAANEDWFEVTYRPIDHHDVSWISSITRTTAAAYVIASDWGTVADGAYPFMATISLAAAVSQPIQYEFWGVVEYAGPQVTGKTMTPPDIQGWASVIAAHSQFDEMHAQSATRTLSAESSFVSSTIRAYATQLLSAAAPYVKQGALAAGQALLQQYTRRRRPLIMEA